MEVGQTLKFIWDSQIEPFTELDMGLDNIINRFRAEFVGGVTGIRASWGYTQFPKNSFMVKCFADKDKVIASFISSSYYESFMQVLEALFHTFVMKNGLWHRETKPLGKLGSLLSTFERTT